MNASGGFDANGTTIICVLEALRPVQDSEVDGSILNALEDILGPDDIPSEDETPDLSLRMRGWIEHFDLLVTTGAELTIDPVLRRALLMSAHADPEG